MFIYEKRNKLNIQFDNKFPSLTPDVRIWKDEQGPHIQVGANIIDAMPKLTKHDDFLYSTEYSYLDYELAKEYFKNPQDYGFGFCSSVRKGGLFGRNFDWFYNNEVEFVIKVSASDNIIGSTSVCAMSSITTDIMRNRKYTDAYKLLPFFALDGYNDYGVFCNSNVMPLDKGTFTKTIPYIKEKDEVSEIALVRYILDHYKSAKEAVEDIANYITVSATKFLTNMQYGIHILVGDATDNYIIEFLPDENGVRRVNYHETSDERPYDNMIMTNFIVNTMTPNSDGTVYTPETQDSTHKPSTTNNITPHGSGLERYNVIVENYDSIEDKDDMIDLMHNKLNYCKSYSTFEDVSNPYWYSEFVGAKISADSSEVTTVDSPIEDFTYAVQVGGNMFDNRDRSQDRSGTWHTTHTSVYDFDNNKLYVYSSAENDECYEFDI